MMNERQIKWERCGLKIFYNKVVKVDILYFGFSCMVIVCFSYKIFINMKL